MLYYEFAPLKEKYETIVISPSTLESVLNPTPDFMQQNDIKKRACTLRTGNIVESIAWERVQNGKDASYKLCNLWRSYINPGRMEFFSGKDNALDKQYLWVYEGLEKISDLFEPYENIGNYNLRSQNSMAILSASGYQVILKGECDWGLLDDNMCMLFDCKTAKSRRDTSSKWLTGCYQSRFYSFLQFLAHPELDEVTFTYLIVIKNKTPKLQEFKVTLTRKEATDFVWMVLKEYLTRLHNGDISGTDEALNRL